MLSGNSQFINLIEICGNHNRSSQGNWQEPLQKTE